MHEPREAAKKESAGKAPARLATRVARRIGGIALIRAMPGRARGVAVLTVALLAVAGVIYALIPNSSGAPSSKGSGGSVGNAAAAGSPVATGNLVGATSAAAGNGTAAAGNGQAPAPQPGAPTAGAPAQNPPPPTSDSPKPLKPTDPARIKSWNAGSGGAALMQVTTQSGNVLQANANAQYPEMRGYCTSLASAVKGAENAAPIPDAAMEKEYRAALNAFGKGAAGCLASVTQHPEGVEDTVTDVNHPGLNRAMAELGVGVKDLYVATEVTRKQ